jgi:hypothetical protein
MLNVNALRPSKHYFPKGIMPFANVGDLIDSKGTSVTQKQMPSQHEQYRSTVHLFIGTGRSPCKITPMPFTFANDSIVIHRGLNSRFPFKSVPFFAIMPKLPCT